ncbi:MAG: N,N-dimethylformamidase beta subunit family domain-containing protein, partial [Ginsengibacter sp.]
MSKTVLCHAMRMHMLILLFAFNICFYASAQNAIVSENTLTGSPSSEWDITGAGDLSIQGFATDISVNKGDNVHFKIDVTDASAFTVKIYRLGYYQGNGARLIANIPGSFNGTQQPSPITDAASGLIDCGNWSESLSWAVPSTAVSGVYIAKLTKTAGGGSSHIFFIVRDDASTSDLYFQTSDATWQAYNVYGGNSLYVGSAPFANGHAAKVSYNRPIITRNGGGGGGVAEDGIFNAE